nr:ROK family protein [Endozoicomonas sp. 4G]
MGVLFRVLFRVLGGGMSNIQALYTELANTVPQYVFSDQLNTRIVPAKHGDSSGVRGAAWL